MGDWNLSAATGPQSSTKSTSFLSQNLTSVWVSVCPKVLLQCNLHSAVLAPCTALSLTLSQGLISPASHHTDDVNSGIPLATPLSSLAISVLLIIVITLYPRQRKSLQQHLQQVWPIVCVEVVNTMRDGLGLEETNVALQTHVQSISDHLGLIMSVTAYF